MHFTMFIQKEFSFFFLKKMALDVTVDEKWAQNLARKLQVDAM